VTKFKEKAGAFLGQKLLPFLWNIIKDSVEETAREMARQEARKIIEKNN
jgi:hypothetical protein